MASAILGGIKRYLAHNPPLARNKVAAMNGSDLTRSTTSLTPLSQSDGVARRSSAACALSIAVASSAVTGREKR